MPKDKNTGRTRATKKTGEALRKDALANAQANIAAIDAEAGGHATNATTRPMPPTTPPGAKKRGGGGTKAKAPKAARGGGAKPPKGERPRKMSALDAAAKVLSESKEPMNAKDMIAEMEKQGLWKSPGGKTPHATIYAAIIREIGRKKREARFVKTERGLFTANPRTRTGKGA